MEESIKKDLILEFCLPRVGHWWYILESGVHLFLKNI